MPNSPLLYGPNAKALNLQEGSIQPSGIYNAFNGPKNYITLGDFENGLATGWTAVGMATVTNGLPASVGASGLAFSSANGGRAAGGTTTAPAVVSSGQLSGSYSLNLATSGAGTVGDMYISQAYNIDLSDQAKVLNISFNYKVVTGTANLSGTSSNTYACGVYDLVNNSWLPVIGAFNFVVGTGVGQFTGTVQTNSTTVGLQLAVYSPVAPAAASALYLDSFYMGPAPVATGAAMTDWVAYTPTFTGFGTPTSVNFYSRRVGDSLEVSGVFVAGTVSPTQAQITLGYNGGNANVVINVSKMVQSAVVGVLTTTSSSTTFFGDYVLGLGGNSFVQFGTQQSTVGAYAPANGNAVAVTGGGISFFATVPIVGWSSNTVQSSDSLQQVVDLAASSNTTSTGSATTAVIFQTVAKDSAGAYNAATGRYTAPISGDYYVGFSGALTTGTVSFGVYVNGTVAGPGNIVTLNATANQGTSVLLPGIKAGDIIDIRPASSATITSGCGLSIFRLSGPAVVQATESVNARYYSSATAVTSSLATVMYTTKGFDTHSAYATGTGFYTIPVSGRYQVNASIAMTGTFVLNSILDLQIQQTGSGTQISESKVYAGGALTQMNTNVGDIFYCLAGDVIKVQVSNSGTTPVIAATTTQNWFSIARVGN